MQGLGQELQTADVADFISELASPAEGVTHTIWGSLQSVCLIG